MYFETKLQCSAKYCIQVSSEAPLEFELIYYYPQCRWLLMLLIF